MPNIGFLTSFRSGRLQVLLLAAGFMLAMNFAVLAQNPSKWEREFRVFRAQDETNAPPKGSVLFTGSSSIRLWTNLSVAFPKVQTVNRGFGGSQYSDLVGNLDLLVVQHAPSKVFFYSGDNDLASGKSPEETLADCRKIQQTLAGKLPRTKLYFISSKPSPSRWHLKDKVESFNRQLKALCDASTNAVYVDVYTPMLDASGKPDPSLFVNDNLHLNGKGYALWARVVDPFVAEAIKPGK